MLALWLNAPITVQRLCNYGDTGVDSVHINKLILVECSSRAASYRTNCLILLRAVHSLINYRELNNIRLAELSDQIHINRQSQQFKISKCSLTIR